MKFTPVIRPGDEGFVGTGSTAHGPGYYVYRGSMFIVNVVRRPGYKPRTEIHHRWNNKVIEAFDGDVSEHLKTDEEILEHITLRGLVSLIEVVQKRGEWEGRQQLQKELRTLLWRCS